MANLPEYQRVGFEPIDREHDALTRALQMLIQEVCGGSLETVDAHLSILLGQVERHFKSEEDFMKATNYPLTARHTEAHRGFTRDAERHRAVFKAQGLTPEFRRWVLDRFSKWFDFHIRANDVALGRHLRDHTTISPASTALGAR